MARAGELIMRLSVALQTLRERAPDVFDHVMEALSFLLRDPAIGQGPGVGDGEALAQRITAIVGSGVDELLVVLAIREYIVVELRRGADVDAGTQKRDEMRAEMTYFMANPGVYRRRAAEAVPPQLKYVDATDAEIVEHLERLLNTLDRLGPDADSATAAWSALATWQEISEQHLASSVFEGWNWAAELGSPTTDTEE